VPGHKKADQQFIDCPGRAKRGLQSLGKKKKI